MAVTGANGAGKLSEISIEYPCKYYSDSVFALAGKSTMIKLLVQEVEPDPDCGGTVWKHMNLRVAYVV